jgi:DNA-binding LacI/PurR family transcriptional regulator
MSIPEEPKQSKAKRKKASGPARLKSADKTKARPAKKALPMNLNRLAEHLGLSPTTISLVLNDSPAGRAIPQRTRDRVSEAAERFGYRPNFFARSLRMSSSMSIGVISPDLSEGYFTQVMGGVEEQLLKAQYFYLTASHRWDEKLIARYSTMLEERAVDGFLLLNTPCVIESTRPVVTISSDRRGAAHTNIALDHDQAAELALRHLYELGHRQVACMRGPELIVDSEYRWNGIERAAKALGLKLDADLCIQLTDSRSSPQVGYEAVTNLLAKHKAFTAIFCFNDISAIGAMSAIRDHGLSVPGNISVIGFDDIVSASYQAPKLTTVRQPLREMGIEGARMLLEQIKTPAKEYPAEILMRPELVVRESTAPVSITGRQARM